MINLGILNEEQFLLIKDKEYKPGCYFNPINYINNQWLISKIEIDECIYPELDWLKNLELVNYDDIKQFLITDERLEP